MVLMKILSCDCPLTRAKYKQVKVKFKFLDPLHSQTFSQEEYMLIYRFYSALFGVQRLWSFLTTF